MGLVGAGQVLALAVSLLVAPIGGVSEADVVAVGAPGRAGDVLTAPLVARHSGKCLDVAADGKGGGVSVQQWTCDGRKSQEWSLKKTDNGYYTVRATHGGQCLDVVNGDRRSGAHVQQWTCMPGARNQEWWLGRRSDGYFVLVARHSGKCLDVQGAGTENGVGVRQWACVRGRVSQEWRLA
ncbi:RICIN domain-containing protein [Streptosporangium sp. NPDC001681]|uniref:RICIN domain-containing protein n=1 Tax=Streptosporangium sp. NPDC001681 TaxID=3154395 RepID=UPI003329912B